MFRYLFYHEGITNLSNNIMTNFYILTFKQSETKFYYTSVKSIYSQFSKDDLKISYKSLGSRSFRKGYYENKLISIERVTAYSSKDFSQDKPNKV